MKRIFTLVIFALLLAGCSKDSVIEPPQEEQKPQPEVPQGPYTPSPLVEGRAVIAYVTYYGTTLPNPQLCTHINYEINFILKNIRFDCSNLITFRLTLSKVLRDLLDHLVYQFLNHYR